MWDAQIDTIDGGRVRQVRVLCDGKPVSYGEVVEGWQSDSVFRAFFIGILADAPYGAYLWETPPITRLTSTRAFEFVLVDSVDLARLIPDPDAFASHFEATETGVEVAVFPTEAVFSYFEETQRHSGAHGARSTKAEDYLCEVIKQAAEDIKSGPVTDDELVVVMAALDAKREAL